MYKKQKNLIDWDKIRTDLIDGIIALNIRLANDQVKKLLDYLLLLDKWNSTYNLTAVRNPQAMLTYHLLDSLAVVPYLSETRRLLDVGSGGGLPGLVLSIVYPDMKVTMIDIVHKKTAFLNQVKFELGLNNVMVYTGRVEELEVDEPFDGIISRAFASLNDFVGLSAHLLSENGLFYAMKGLIPGDEISNLESGWTVKRIEALKVPQLDAQRHLLFIDKKK